MFNSFQIANYFIKKSQDTGEELTPIKLIKLCYISHGWYLGYNDKSLIDETIFAWKYGPVIESLYKEFKHYGAEQITELYRDAKGNYPMPDEETINFLNAIWKSYGKLTGIQLSSLTHSDNTPWDIIWNKEKHKYNRNSIIPNNLIKEYYQEKIQQARKNNIPA